MDDGEEYTEITGTGVPQLTRYENDWKMVNEFIQDLQQEGCLVNGTRNVPNQLFEQIDWNALDALNEKLETLRKIENFEDLNRVD